MSCLALRYAFRLPLRTDRSSENALTQGIQASASSSRKLAVSRLCWDCTRCDQHQHLPLPFYYAMGERALHGCFRREPRLMIVESTVCLGKRAHDLQVRFSVAHVFRSIDKRQYNLPLCVSPTPDRCGHLDAIDQHGLGFQSCSIGPRTASLNVEHGTRAGFPEFCCIRDLQMTGLL